MRAVMWTSTFLLTLLGSSIFNEVLSFAPPRASFRGVHDRLPVALEAKSKKKRRRKQPPASQSKAPVASDPTPVQPEVVDIKSDTTMVVAGNEAGGKEDLTVGELDDIAGVANFEFKPSKEEIAAGVQDDEETDAQLSEAIPLPDIREARQKKKIEEEAARIEEEKALNTVKVKRSDKEAFTKLLEQSPYSDADDSLFEEEEYGAVSALLGERAEKFLGLPTGPLQVGHFVGALGITLMAFIEYPGFPLTNLPTPLRDCLQGGLASVYAINALLAAVAFFKAGERGQPQLLWVAKTFSVGGLAYDQLTQLPTTEEIEKAKSRKGARSLENLMKKR